MARFAIGDIQGCAAELAALVKRIGFSADRDRLWFVGDLVNRGPASLEALRYIRSLGENAVVVLGNHDLHLLAVALGKAPERSGDTLSQILRASDRGALLEWLLQRPLAHQDAPGGDLLIHAGLVPQWSVPEALTLTGEASAALRLDPEAFFAHMYGDQPDHWRGDLAGMERWRFIVNTLTRLRVCAADGRINLKLKGPPPGAGPFRPWFEIETRRSRDTRIVFGHWSALGYLNAHGVIALDTGCVWGGALTAIDLDADAGPVSIPCTGYQALEE
jgi:bis(5'-nucleosyl)-tetraphosphatase (symmetrical)